MRLFVATRRTSIMSMKKTEFVAETPFNRKGMFFLRYTRYIREGGKRCSWMSLAKIPPEPVYRRGRRLEIVKEKEAEETVYERESITLR